VVEVLVMPEKSARAKVQIKVALAHPAASNGVCSRHRSKLHKGNNNPNTI